MRKVCGVPTDPHPFSLSVLGKQCQKHRRCSREKRAWEGNDLSRWISMNMEKGMLVSQVKSPKRCFSFLFHLWRVQGSQGNREGVGTVLLEQCWLWIDCCASSLFLLSSNLQPMKKANTMMVAQCCLRTTKSSANISLSFMCLVLFLTLF